MENPGHFSVEINTSVLLRFASGAKGMIWASQFTPGTKNALRLRIAGSKVGVAWDQENPDFLEFTPFGQPSRRLRRGVGLRDTTARILVGHPASRLDAFATLYADTANML